MKNPDPVAVMRADFPRIKAAAARRARLSGRLFPTPARKRNEPPRAP
jgi:hypothetical protein